MIVSDLCSSQGVAAAEVFVVLVLIVMLLGGFRTQLEEVRSENRALKERLSVLQQEVHSLEDDIAKERRVYADCD